jgi:hypothetical protein
MKTNNGRHLSPNEIIRLLQQPTLAAPAAAQTPQAPAATPTAAPAASTAPAPAASTATGTPPSNWRTDWMRSRADRKAAKSDTLNKKADRTDKRKNK